MGLGVSVERVCREEDRREEDGGASWESNRQRAGEYHWRRGCRVSFSECAIAVAIFTE